MPAVVLTTVNARYMHSAFGLRYLRASLDGVDCEICEFTLQDNAADIAERLLRQEPRVIGFGVYIWNALITREIVARIRAVRPDIVLVLGGPEVSYDDRDAEMTALVDYVITGEGELAFAKLVGEVLDGSAPERSVVPGGLPDLERLPLPYDLYDDVDVADRLIYVEASRGCPFKCEFCLSALDERVRAFVLEDFLAAMQRLLERGVRHFKFVDRTFNLKTSTSRRILEFFFERYTQGLFLHFEMIPDRLPAELRDVIAAFPAGALQFEVGIQTFDAETAARIQRRLDVPAVEANLRFLREHTGVHVHADLIAGLPGEDLESFARGFDHLVALGPQEIQVGILKRLRGAPMARHDERMRYSPTPPYEILQSDALDYLTLQRLKRFAMLWDRVANSGNFVATLPTLWGEGSPFWGFLAFADWLHAQEGRVHSISLNRLARALDRYLAALRPGGDGRRLILNDFARLGREPPGFEVTKPARPAKRAAIPARQARHLAT